MRAPPESLSPTTGAPTSQSWLEGENARAAEGALYHLRTTVAAAR
jgi:hypothetical protein